MKVLRVPKVHAVEGVFDYQIPFRNTLLQHLYPEIQATVLQVAKDDRADMKRVLAGNIEGQKLDIASGSRKWGCFTFTDQKVGKRFWNSPEEVMAYGSNLLTCCIQEPKTHQVRVRVVEDGEAGTGDCHARMCAIFAMFALGTVNRAAQFRMVAGDALAKGTMMTYSPTTVLDDVDVIIPLSAFKSSDKPCLGDHTWFAHIAVAAWSQRRKAKVSYTVLQWFRKETLVQDVLPKLVEQAETLVEAGRNPRRLDELLDLDEVEATLAEVIVADEHRKLEGHPWVVKGIARMLRRRWMQLALGGGLRAISLQGVPREGLANNVISSSDLAPGWHISFRYPIRTWADIKMWKNVRPQTTTHKGVVAMNHATAAQVAGDFDGDYFCFLEADEYPNMAREVLEWHLHRETTPIALKKTRLSSPWSSMADICLDQIDNAVGLVSFFISQAAAAKRLDIVEQLAPQLQIAVDKFKFDLKQDWPLIDQCGNELKPVTWLKDRRSRQAYISRLLAVDEYATDVISWLVRTVNRLWVPLEMQMAPIHEFLPLMEQPKAHVAAAAKINRRYAQAVSDALNSNNAAEAITRILKQLRAWADSREDPDEWARAFWAIAHRKGTKGSGSIAFHAFPEQVIQMLAEPTKLPEQAAIVGLRYHDLEALDLTPGPYGALSWFVDISTVLFGGCRRRLATIGDRALGLVSTETPLPIGSHDMSLKRIGQVVYARPNGQGQ